MGKSEVDTWKRDSSRAVSCIGPVDIDAPHLLNATHVQRGVGLKNMVNVMIAGETPGRQVRNVAMR